MKWGNKLRQKYLKKVIKVSVRIKWLKPEFKKRSNNLIKCKYIHNCSLEINKQEFRAYLLYLVLIFIKKNAHFQYTLN